MRSDDAALLERIAAGDESALAALYRAYEPRVYAFALSRLNDPAAAADVLNEVMLEVWRNANRFEGRSADRAFKLRFRSTSEYGCYVKPLRGARRREPAQPLEVVARRYRGQLSRAIQRPSSSPCWAAGDRFPRSAMNWARNMSPTAENIEMVPRRCPEYVDRGRTPAVLAEKARNDRIPTGTTTG